MRDATLPPHYKILQTHFNPRVLCGTRRYLTGRVPRGLNFNPRVLCGTRLISRFLLTFLFHFNPRVLCGTRPYNCCNTSSDQEFQSTRPMRDATRESFLNQLLPTDFNPRVLCGTRLDGPCIYRASLPLFQSTRPMRDATSGTGVVQVTATISIHASYAGRDHCKS